MLLLSPCWHLLFLLLTHSCCSHAGVHLRPRARIVRCNNAAHRAILAAIHEIHDLASLAWNVTHSSSRIHIGRELFVQWSQAHPAIAPLADPIFRRVANEAEWSLGRARPPDGIRELHLTCDDAEGRCVAYQNIAYLARDRQRWVICPGRFFRQLRLLGGIDSINDQVSVLFEIFMRSVPGNRITQHSRIERHYHLRPLVLLAKELQLDRQIDQALVDIESGGEQNSHNSGIQIVDDDSGDSGLHNIN